MRVFLFLPFLWPAIGWAAGLAPSNAPLRIVTSFYPIYIAVLNIAYDVPGVEVANLTGPSAGCLHDHQMSPGEMVALSRSDICVVNGAGLESFLKKAVQEMPGLRLVDASRGIDPIRYASAKQGDVNPHVWVSPALHIRQVQNIADGLAGYDPARAAQYRGKAHDYIRRLEDLRLRIREALKAVKTRDIITFHEAFPYFAREFGLNVVAVIEREPGSEPSSRELADIIGVAKKTGVTALFAEPQYSDKAAVVIARETQAKVYLLDPVVTGPMSRDAYLQAMERNLRVMQEALK